MPRSQAIAAPAVVSALPGRLERWRIELITPYDRNPRRIPEQALATESRFEFGALHQGSEFSLGDFAEMR